MVEYGFELLKGLLDRIILGGNLPYRVAILDLIATAIRKAIHSVSGHSTDVERPLKIRKDTT